MASVNIAYHTIGMVNTITFAYINPALWIYYMQKYIVHIFDEVV